MRILTLALPLLLIDMCACKQLSLSFFLPHSLAHSLTRSLGTGNWAGFAIGCGAHRLWAHKSYDACLALRTFWAVGQTIAGQNCIYIWCRDHRVHHKFSTLTVTRTTRVAATSSPTSVGS